MSLSIILPIAFSHVRVNTVQGAAFLTVAAVFFGSSNAPAVRIR